MPSFCHHHLLFAVITMIFTAVSTNTFRTPLVRAFHLATAAAPRRPSPAIHTSVGRRMQTTTTFSKTKATATTPSRLFSTTTSDDSTVNVKPRDSLDEISQTGEFQRRDSAWRNWISRDQEDAEFPPEAGRYHLIVAYACPWAHRTLMTRSLKGLQDCISVSVVHPIWQRTKPTVEGDTHRGWVFGNPNGEPLTNADGRGGPFVPAYPGNDPDPLFGFPSVRSFYEHAKDTEGKYTVPVLYDTKSDTIVSNESAEIM